MRTTMLMALALVAAACASAPPAPPPAAILPSFEEKMAWVLRLEDQRVLRDPVPAVAPVAPPIVLRRGEKLPVAPPLPPPPPDLVRLLSDGEARVRRRAALAIGHVGLREGVAPLVGLLVDPEPEVRQMAAFSLGLLGDKAAREPLVAALTDPSPLVQGSAAEALGLLGDKVAADAVGRLALQVVQSGALATVPGPDMDARRDTPVAAFRLAIYALVRLNAYEQLAAAVLDASGQPRVRWWPVAYALQRIEDQRALPALLTLAKEQDPYTRAFAVKGLGALKASGAVPVLAPLLVAAERTVVLEAIRALGRIGVGAASAAPAVVRLIQTRGVDATVRAEALGILGSLHAPATLDLLLDTLTDRDPTVRAATLRSTAALDADQFVAVLSGLDPDPDWSVRATLATVLATLPSDAALPRLTAMLSDREPKVLPAVLESLIKLRPSNITGLLLQRLTADDPVVRAIAATGLGELKPASGPQALAAAYQSGLRDTSYTARAAVLAALTNYGAAVATPVLRTALTDKDWAVRVRAAMLLKQFDPSGAEEIDRQMRPAPTNLVPDTYAEKRLVNPPVSLAVFIDTDRGTIQIELAMLEAPLAVENFVALARKGYFNGLAVHRVVPGFVLQTGDPRGDGEGGPGYTIRDELNQQPFLRGTVGMALDPWPDTGGSQFFITHSPQPHLDGKYTVFGRVLAGMEVVDAIQQGDIIRRVRVWDGETMTRSFGF